MPTDTAASRPLLTNDQGSSRPSSNTKTTTSIRSLEHAGASGSYQTKRINPEDADEGEEEEEDVYEDQRPLLSAPLTQAKDLALPAHGDGKDGRDVESRSGSVH